MRHHSFLTQPMSVFLRIVDECQRESFISGHGREGADQVAWGPFVCIHLCEDELNLGDHSLTGVEGKGITCSWSWPDTCE